MAKKIFDDLSIFRLNDHEMQYLCGKIGSGSHVKHIAPGGFARSVLERVIALDIDPRKFHEGVVLAHPEVTSPIQNYWNAVGRGLMEFYETASQSDYHRALLYNVKHKKALGYYFYGHFAYQGWEGAKDLRLTLSRDPEGNLYPKEVLGLISNRSPATEALLGNALVLNDLEAVQALLSLPRVEKRYPLQKLIDFGTKIGVSSSFLDQLGGDNGGYDQAYVRLEQYLNDEKCLSLDASVLRPVLLKYPHEAMRVLKKSNQGKVNACKKLSQVLAYVHSNGGDIYPSFKVLVEGDYGWMSALERQPNFPAEMREILDFVSTVSKNRLPAATAFLVAVPNEEILLHEKSDELLLMKYQVTGDKESFRLINNRSMKVKHLGRGLSL
ncbi:hypothetical protein ACYPKM_05420 [Pseudomonas aeruginosa]